MPLYALFTIHAPHPQPFPSPHTSPPSPVSHCTLLLPRGALAGRPEKAWTRMVKGMDNGVSLLVTLFQTWRPPVWEEAQLPKEERRWVLRIELLPAWL